MRKTTTCAAFAVLAGTTAAFADLETSGSLWLGYADDGYGNAGTIVRGDFDTTGQFQLGGNTTLEFAIGFDAIWDEDDNPAVRAELDDYTVSLDFGTLGKLTYSTEARCSALDVFWSDGRIKSDGAHAAHLEVPPKFRCVGGGDALLNAGNGTPLVVQANDYLKYENKFGAFGIEAYYDPDRDYGSQSGDGAETLNNWTPTSRGDLPAQAELVVNYANKLGLFSLSTNDLGDYWANAVLPVPAANLAVIVGHQFKNVDGNNAGNDFIVDWKPQNLGAFKGGIAFYTMDELDEKLLVTANFAVEKWDLGLTADSDGDFAVEAGYQIADNMKIMFGAETGFADGDGFNLDVFGPEGPASAPARDARFEFGLMMTF
jgi:opacity protein-like surface antigen